MWSNSTLHFFFILLLSACIFFKIYFHMFIPITFKKVVNIKCTLNIIIRLRLYTHFLHLNIHFFLHMQYLYALFLFDMMHLAVCFNMHLCSQIFISYLLIWLVILYAFPLFEYPYAASWLFISAMHFMDINIRFFFIWWIWTLLSLSIVCI